MYVAEVPGAVPRDMPELPNGTTRLLRPSYTVRSSYKDTVDSWISNAANDSGRQSSISFKPTDSNTINWQSLGYSDVPTAWTFDKCIFFKVRYYVNTVLKEEQIAAQEAGPDVSVTLTASDFGTFSITPGDW